MTMPGPCKARGGFSLIELLVVIAIVGILAALLLPSLNKAKQKAHGIYCMNNHRSLMLAWRMYADDNDDQITYASEYPWWPDSYSRSWVTGTLDMNPNNRSNWDPEQDIKKSPLWAYCGNNLSIWRCPADDSKVVVEGEAKPRVRSMSMNIYLGGWGGSYGGWGYEISRCKLYMKLSDIVDPTPSQMFVLLDMREDSIDMGNLCVNMSGWREDPNQYRFWDLPGIYHNGASGFSFADGHSEIKKWRHPDTTPPLVRSGFVRDVFMSPNNPDIEWLQERATRPK
jgi:prepilin-type N-terminal cleavage/methylation domain-containing protein/prepilin-type processing-associated H-X9-DG protein